MTTKNVYGIIVLGRTTLSDLSDIFDEFEEMGGKITVRVLNGKVIHSTSSLVISQGPILELSGTIDEDKDIANIDNPRLIAISRETPETIQSSHITDAGNTPPIEGGVHMKDIFYTYTTIGSKEHTGDDLEKQFADTVMDCLGSDHYGWDRVKQCMDKLSRSAQYTRISLHFHLVGVPDLPIILSYSVFSKSFEIFIGELGVPMSVTSVSDLRTAINYACNLPEDEFTSLT